MSETEALAAQIQSLLDQFRAVEQKARHVRNTQYWRAPYGTPLPLHRADSSVAIPQGWPDSLTEPSDEYREALVGSSLWPNFWTARSASQVRGAAVGNVARVWGKSTPEERAHAIETAREIRKGDVAIAIDPQPIWNILTEGQPFRSQFSTGTSNGALDPDDRANTELALFDVPLNHDPAERPIYGYMVSDTAPPYQKSVKHYGAIRVVLKRSVRERTTMTLTDSLDCNKIPVPLTGKVSDDRLFAANTEDLDVREVGSSFYAEAQIHGGVSADDIAEIWFPVAGSLSEATGFRREHIEEMLRISKERGIRVRWYGEEKDERGGGIILFHTVEKQTPEEFKGIRRVRDPLYWGKPYGTPITPGMTPLHGVVPIPIPGVPEIPDPIPTRSKRGTWVKDVRESSMVGDGALPGSATIYTNSRGDMVVFEEGVVADEETRLAALADVDWMLDYLPEEMDNTTVDVVIPANDMIFSDISTDTPTWKLRDKVTLGYVVNGSRVIHLNPTLLKGDEKYWPVVKRSWRSSAVPALQDEEKVSLRRGVLMHESGHVVENYISPLDKARAGEKAANQKVYLDNLDAISDYGRGDMVEAYAEMYAEWMLGDPSHNDSWKAAQDYARLYEWGEPRAGVKALLADLDRTMIELKRKVRDADYWGWPVGTPFPLPKKPDVDFSILDVSLPDLDEGGRFPESMQSDDDPWAHFGYRIDMRAPGVDPRIYERLSEVFGYEEEINGHQWKTEVKWGELSISAYPGAMTGQVGGRIYRDGEEVGAFKRTVWLGPAPLNRHEPSVRVRLNSYTPWVSHDLLRLHPSVTGQGFAERYNDKVDAALYREGYRHEWLEANIDVGGYAWARRGYDWFDAIGEVEGHDSKTIARDWGKYLIPDMEKEILRQQPEADQTITSDQRFGYPGPFDQALVDAMQEMAERVFDGEASPAEVAALGEGDPRYAWTGHTIKAAPHNGMGPIGGRSENIHLPVPMWPGKWLMLHSRWYGIRRIAPPAQEKVLSRQEYQSRVRETIEEFERTYEPAYYRNPTRSDFNIMGADLLLGPQSPNEVKVRHVRDSEYWNAPVGTPLPLPKKPKGKKKKLTEWSAGGGSHPVPPEVEQTLREIYEMTYQHGDTTYRTKIDHTPWAKTYATGSYITVQGVVIINGEPQGRFVRELSLDYAPEYDDDLVQYSPWVHNSMFGIASEYQGQGFAEAFYAHTEERLAEEGFRYEWMEANIDIGGYAWARRGFHFRDRRGRERIGFRIKWLYDNIDKMARTEAQGREPDPEVELNLAEYGGPLDDPVLGTQMFHLANAVLDGTAQPEDVAAFGEDHPEWHWIDQTAGREPIPMWPGKWIMLGTGWNGIRPLAPDGQQKDMRADHMATVRATLAHAEEVYIPGDYYRNPERSDYNIMGADLLAGPIGPQTKGVRHVRDAAYWGAPVGTPLPLGIKPSTVAVEEETDFGYIEEEPPDTQALLTEAQRDYVAQRLIEINGGTMPERYEGHGYGALRPNVYKAVVAHDLAIALDDVSTEDLLNALREPGAASLYPHWYQTVTDPESDELLTLRDNGGFGLVGYEVPRADLFGRMPVKAGTPEAEQRFREFLLSVYVQAWANTSNDHSVLSHCLQNAARRAFDLDEAADWEPSTADGANKFTEIEADIEQMDEDYGDVYEAVVRAQYENTQEFLKDAGIETLIVYRGTRLTQRESNWLDNNGVVVTRPLSSWSTSLVTAYGFQHGVSRKRPVTVQSVVSAKDVFATPATGIGCLDEDEVVLLGRTYDVGLSTPSWMLSKTIGPMPVVNVDNDDLNADWIKTLHWDLPTDPAYYRGTDQLARLANLPAGQAMPDELRMLLALQSHEEELKTLLDGFLAVERKVRHVRDSDYWGAPEGTPLPLAKPMDRESFQFVVGEYLKRQGVEPKYWSEPEEAYPPYRHRPHPYDDDNTSKAKAVAARDVAARMTDVDLNDLVVAAGAVEWDGPVSSPMDWLNPHDIEVILTGEGTLQDGPEDRLGDGSALDDEAVPNDKIRVTLDPSGMLSVIAVTEGEKIKTRKGKPKHYTDTLGRKPVKMGTPEAEQYIRESLVAILIDEWATSSNETPLAYGIQEAAKAEFGLEGTARWSGWVTHQYKDSVFSKAKPQKVLRRFVRAQYENTQAMLKEMGITGTVEVMRGFHADLPKKTKSIQTRPLSSWTTYAYRAEEFAMGPSRHDPIVVSTMVPVERIFSTPATGVGCLREDEVVLLGGTDPAKKIKFYSAIEWADHWLDPERDYYDDHRAFTVDMAGSKAATITHGVLVLDTPQTADWPKRTPDRREALHPETKGVRHVRDSAFWGAPVGTPLPLPKNTSAVTFRDDREWNAAYDEYNDLPYLDKFTDDELTLTREQYMADRKPTLDPVPQERQEQIREIVDGLAADFPQVLTRNDVDAVQVIFGADRDDELAHAGGHPPKLVLSQNLIGDEKALIERLYNEGHAMPGMIGHSQAVRDEDYQAILRTVLTHEFGHVLDMAARRDAKAYRELLDLTDDTTAQWAPEEDRDRFTGGPRWQMDPLIRRGGSNDTMWGSNFHSMYATEARSEWIAEAFADGYLNGDNASDPGKAVLAYFQKVLG